jgi:AraC-like DNA-binding protein
MPGSLSLSVNAGAAPTTARRIMALPSDALVSRLLRRDAPDNYFIGANARCFRSVRQVTLFARCPLFVPTADLHNRFVLILGIGQGTAVACGERVHVIGPGQALLVPPFTLHRYAQLREEPQPLAFVGFASDMGDDAPDGVASVGLDAGVVPVSAEAWQVLDQLEAACDARPALLPALTLQLLEVLAEGAPGAAGKPVEHADWARTQRVAQVARHHPAFAVHELARACGASEGVLRSAVLEITGMPIARFMRQIRLQHTFALVARRQFAAAAERAGYATPEAYAKAFKAEFGIAPAQFANLAADNGWRIRPKPVPG